jgi:peptidoglycan-associated lipoprotein
MTAHTTIKTKTAQLLVLAVAVLAPGGCKRSNATDSEEPVAQAKTQPTRPAPAAAPAETRGATVFVAEDVRVVCELPTEQFAFDSDVLTPEDEQMLTLLISCFGSGKAADRGMKLVGRADQRGTETYNDALGQRRADQVAKYLRENGMVDERLQMSSRGERDATGTDESGWANDRRVDILFAD